ncbi:hexitol phosphatase HxpB [Sediminibacterium sp. C3]|uniref:hexitol phosphatase HxpB n=1 Tax=Sediminibacterium sp. C3 TaxID=1267211 RepID=UPI00040A694F|nr:hexitol phosphatase HxpB [Sediminibacterium sp. C3]
MALTTVIFDIDGLLIDSEPLWHEAATDTFKSYGVQLSNAMYASTTGLRTKEFVDWWFQYFKIDMQHAPDAEKEIVKGVLKKIEEKASIMPGVPHIFDFFANKEFKIGLATSSPPELIDLVVRMTGIGPYLSATSSAEFLPYGKPHPQVYLNCAEAMNSKPTECICFEDSFNGMIAAKSARMKCVVIPHHSQTKEEKWGAADLKLSSLQNFGELHFDRLFNS